MAPELLLCRGDEDAQGTKQSKKLDVFALGCLVHYTLTGGRHPFGDTFERDQNIVLNKQKLKYVTHIPEASSLVGAMLAPNPRDRPTIQAVLSHPFWWTPDTKLAFLVQLSDRVEKEDQAAD